MAKEQFFYSESAGLLKTLDEASDRSGVSRGQTFSDFLHMVVCSLSGRRMEDQYLGVVKNHSRGEQGRRGCDLLARMFGELVEAMEQTRGDVLGDLFQGAITYGENGQFLTPEPVGRMMAQMMVSDVPEDERHEAKRVCDPATGSGRMLLAVAEMQPHWLFVGRDIDLRCVRMTAINLALRNLYGYVIWGNSLADERRLVYRTGFDLKGFISEVPISDCPEPVQQIVSEPAVASSQVTTEEPNRTEESGVSELTARQTNQLRLF